MSIYLTGLPAIDKLLQPVFYTGYMLTVTGTPGSGTELLSKQFAVNGIGKQDVLYVTTSERDEDVIETLKRFGWNTSMKIMSIGNDYYENILAKEFQVSKHREEGVQLSNIVDISNINLGYEEYYIPNYITKVIYEISKDIPPKRIVIDSIDFFLEEYDSKSVISFLRLLRSHAVKNECELLITMTSNMHEKWIENAIEDISDAVIRLDKERRADEVLQYLTVWRIRNHPEKGTIFSYNFTDNGIDVIEESFVK